jgi:hypothetical protein
MCRKLLHPPKHVSFNIKVDRMLAPKVQNLLLPDKFIPVEWLSQGRLKRQEPDLG